MPDMFERSPALSAWEDVGDEQPPSYRELYGRPDSPSGESDASWDFTDEPKTKDQAPTQSIPQLPDEPKTKDEALFQSIPQLPEKRCSHWDLRRCQMTASSYQCCSCSDTRPWSDSMRYETYVDGRGYVCEATRWQHYCPGCKAHGDEMEAQRPKTRHEERTGLPRVKKPKRRRQPPQPDLDRQRRELESKRIKEQRRTERGTMFQTTRCVHWLPRDCHLISTKGKCCECCDQRRHAHEFLTYVDGVGDVRGAARHMHYCPGCKAAHEQPTWALNPEHLLIGNHGESMQTGNSKKTIRNKPKQKIRPAQASAIAASSDRPCNHWFANKCSLTSKKCCACMDQRAEANGYAKYVDGLGDVHTATRWEYYCPGCVEIACPQIKPTPGKRRPERHGIGDWLKRSTEKLVKNLCI